MGIRRKGREIAIQTLYSLEFSDFDIHQVQEKEIKNILKNVAADTDIQPDNNIYDFAFEIVNGVIQNIDPIDVQIKARSINWSFERIAKLDLGIIRVATYELVFTETAPAIIMNEAIEIAKKYCSESSGKFINGVLNAIKEAISK
ncbi:MAG: transcription antitermination factor NusB [Candidatus Cloacimonetes bacterium]|nr:transcription antitermination factor NusB [Candidatus Cloacimonadota bacterium]